MQNQQMVMAGMNAHAGPVDGTPVMANGQRVLPNQQQDPRNHLNTYIYDYFLRNNHSKICRMMLESDMNMNLNTSAKPSPSGRNVNGVDADSKDDLPLPKIPMGQASDHSFLLDWWMQFWDIFGAARKQDNKPSNTTQYIGHARNIAQMQNDQRNQRMMMQNGLNPQQYQNMMRAIPNGVAPNDLKRAAAMKSLNPNGTNPMANMNQMKNQSMMAQQMQRDGSQMDMNGQRPQSPSANDSGAPSPNKRPRVEGAMNAPNMGGGQFNEFNQPAQGGPQKSLEGMNSGVQGSPMNQQGGLDGQHDLFTGNQPRAPGIPTGAPGPPQGNHALQDYQMQLMLLEQQNKKRLLMARQEQDSMSGPQAQAAIGGPGFPPNMSPPGNRAGPSPNPTDQMKKGTPRMGQPGLPGSPMPEGQAMQQQRNSPAPGMPFVDPSSMPPGMPPQFYNPGQMPQNGMMMRPPSSHPNFQGQQLTPQQMETMRQNQMQNGVWRGGPQGQPGMMQPGQQQMGPMANTPQQRGQMAPPPAPPGGEPPRAPEASPSQPAAPPTPSTGNKPNPKKKGTKDNKKPANKAKGANTGATPAATGGEEAPTPTPSTPITPMHPKSFGQNGQPQPPQQAAQPQPPAAQQPPPPMDNGPPFGTFGDEPNFDNLGLGFDDQNALENFDFDSFLHVGDDTGGLAFDGGFNFGDGVEAGGDAA